MENKREYPALQRVERAVDVLVRISGGNGQVAAAVVLEEVRKLEERVFDLEEEIEAIKRLQCWEDAQRSE